MKKLEIIYREILHAFFSEKRQEFTQQELAEVLGLSVSTVFNALEAPRQNGAIKVTGRNFRLTDAEKLLTYWATRRRQGRDILYETRAEGTAREREGLMPADVIFGAFSAYRMTYQETPADYDVVLVYAASALAVKARYPEKRGPSNVIVLKSDPRLAHFGLLTPPEQTYVDLWNLPQWYAQDFRKALHERLFPS